VLIDPRTGSRVRLRLKAEISVLIGVHGLGKASDVCLVEGESPVFSGVVGRAHDVYETAALTSVLLDLMEVSTIRSHLESGGLFVNDDVVLRLDLHHL